MIKEVDREIYHLKEQMISLGLNDVSVMICSDHGMTPIKETFDIEDALDYEDITVLIPEGATVKIWPKDGALEKVILYIVHNKSTFSLNVNWGKHFPIFCTNACN